MSELNDPEEIDVTDEFLPPIYVQLARIYDLVAVIARKVDEENADAVLDLHEEGRLFGAPPAIAADDDD